MDVLDKEKMLLLIKDYGALAVLEEFREALQVCADDYSDLGLKERAHETVEVIELLAKLNDDIE